MADQYPAVAGTSDATAALQTLANTKLDTVHTDEAATLAKLELIRLAAVDTAAIAQVKPYEYATRREVALVFDLAATTNTTEALLSNGILYRDNVQISAALSNYTVPATWRFVMDNWVFFFESSATMTATAGCRGRLRALTQATPVVVGSPFIDVAGGSASSGANTPATPVRGAANLGRWFSAGDSLGISFKILNWAATVNPLVGGVILGYEYQP